MTGVPGVDGIYSYAKIINGRLSFVQRCGAEAVDESAAAVQHVIYFNKDPFEMVEDHHEYSHKTYM